MRIIFTKEPNPVFECAVLTFKIVNHESYKDKKSFYASKYQTDAGILDDCFTSLSNISREIAAKVRGSVKQVESFFKANSLGSCCAFYLLHGPMMNRQPDIFSAANSVKNISKAEFFMNFYQMLSMQDKKAKFSRDVKNYNDLINFISAMTIPNEEKWELCHFYNNFDSNRDILADYLLEMGQAYYEVYDSMESHVNHYVDTIEQPLAKGGVAYLNSNFGLELNDQINSVTVVPSVILGADMKYLFNYTSDTVDDVLVIGGYYEPFGRIAGDGERLTDLCGSLKALGDTSKLKILKILSTGPRFGQELAQMLGISTATVSHHVSILEEYGFIVLDRKQNRVYYSLNRDRINELISTLGSELS
ncbi:MAG: winged helix-turn-helix transcriptional regulator [Clostridia bacterium]|nr:winged helix-turn-helix transcriptional regulator [Clostridia bacterium]